MTLNEEQIRKDDERWGYLDVIKELKYSSLEVKHRLNTTDYDLHYHAWLHRASLNRLQEYAPVVHGHWENKYERHYIFFGTCSVCKHVCQENNICGNCGAIMDEREV